MALTATGSKIVVAGALPVILVAAEDLEAGDLVTADGYKADANNSRYAEYVAGHDIGSGGYVTCYRVAIVGGMSGGAGLGTALYLSDTAGDPSETASTTRGQVVGQEIDATNALFAPMYSGVNTLPDNVQLVFGTGSDVTVAWDGTNLEVLPAVNDTGSFNIGNGTTDFDVKIFLGSATEFVLFDVGNSVVDADVPFDVDPPTLTAAGDAFNIDVDANHATADVSTLDVRMASVTTNRTGGVISAITARITSLSGDTGGDFNCLEGFSTDGGGTTPSHNFLYTRDAMDNFLKVAASGDGGVTVSNDGMTADPETDTEDGYITVDVGGTGYQIPIYTA